MINLFDPTFLTGSLPDTCYNTCSRASDGACDDGGPGAVSSGCELGSDCTDCGPRPDGDPGGGIYASSGTLIIDSATFEDNWALSAGCDLYLSSDVDDAELFTFTHLAAVLPKFDGNRRTRWRGVLRRRQHRRQHSVLLHIL